MSNPNKNVMLRALIDAAITELYPQTTAEQILLTQNTTLAAKVAEMIAAINLRAKISDVDADLQALKNELTSSSTSYTDTKIAELINGAPTTLDTLAEVATAMSENEDVVKALEAAIGLKASQSDFNAHASNTTVHIMDTERNTWNDANSKKHEHSNKLVLDNTTASYTTAEKNKLSGIAAGAEVNQNAFAKVVVGDTTIEADAKSDSLTLAAGSNITLTPDASGDKVTIAAKDTTYVEVTSSASGLMSATDKAKLDSIKVGEASSLKGLSASVTELNYMSGATSNIQAQINALQAAINAINAALPYSIAINDSAGTINFTDR